MSRTEKKKSDFGKFDSLSAVTVVFWTHWHQQCDKFMISFGKVEIEKKNTYSIMA